MILLTKKELDYFQLLSGSITELEVSLDLGITKTKVKINKNTLEIEEHKVDLSNMRKIKDGTVYKIVNNEIEPVEIFSQETNKLYKLVPTKDWPTVTISSTPMHKVNFSSPKEDTLEKIKALGEIKGNALDTCMGAGYTAIQLSIRCNKVKIFEIDKNMIEMSKVNPYAKALFDNDNIELINGNIFEEIEKLGSSSFDVIIHDPPTYKYAPLLYSSLFYAELNRVLKRNGKIYHYAPMPNVKSGRDFPREMEKRLKKEFKYVTFCEKAQGFVISHIDLGYEKEIDE